MNEVLKICGQEVVWLIHIFVYSTCHLVLNHFLFNCVYYFGTGCKEFERFAITYFGHCSREAEAHQCT